MSNREIRFSVPATKAQSIALSSQPGIVCHCLAAQQESSQKEDFKKKRKVQRKIRNCGKIKKKLLMFVRIIESGMRERTSLARVLFFV